MANQYTKARAEAAAAAAALADKRERAELAGIPDSRPFIAEAGTFEPNNRLNGCHFNGTPVSELPAEFQAHLRYEVTDEGLALRDRQIEEARQAGLLSRVEFVESDAETEAKRFGQQREQLAKGASYDEADNPLNDRMKEHLKPGQRGRWLDPEVCDQLGMRGYQPVLDKNGNKVTCGQSFLGFIPEDLAQQREKNRDAKAAAKLAMVQGEVKEQVGQLSHAQHKAGLPVGATGAPHAAGLRIERREVGMSPVNAGE